MTTLKEISEFAQLAQAAYVDLTEMNNARVRDALIGLKDKAFSATQASRLIGPDGYSVVDISANANDDVGFSATLFKSNRPDEPNTYTLAIRGTEPETFEDKVHSAAAIVLNGVVERQILSLYNYVQRLITPQGTMVKQLRLALGSDDGATLDYFVVPYERDNALGTLIKAGPPGTVKLNVTGHSLGGHLGQAMQRMFPEWVDAVYAHNTAGFYPGNADPFFARINSLHADGVNSWDAGFDESKIFNVYSYNGGEYITNDLVHTQYGQRIGVLIEDRAPTLSGNHSIVLQADGLALQALFERIDPSFDPTPRVGQEPAFSRIDDLVRAGAFDHRTTYEATLKRLAKMVLGVEKSVDDLDETSKREDFYKTLYDVRDAVHNRRANNDALAIRSLIDVAASGIVESARADNGLAHRVALRELSPFVVEGIDYASVYPGALTGALGLYDPATRQGELSADWILDRAAFLTWSILGARNDREVIVHPDAPAQVFRDVARRVGVITAGPMMDLSLPSFLNNSPQFVFGGAGADLVQGRSAGDRLYGMEGTDWMEGGRGNDYLEGGRGLDVYQFDLSTVPLVGFHDGQDTILDIDGRGVLRVRENSLLGGEKVSFVVDASIRRTDTLWQSEDEKFTFTPLPQRAGRDRGTIGSCRTVSVPYRESPRHFPFIWADWTVGDNHAISHA